MKISFNPPLTPWLSKKVPISDFVKLREPITTPIKCPECGSLNVWAYALVHAHGWVNLNTAEVEDPEDGEADLEDARDEECRICYNCQHEWEKE